MLIITKDERKKKEALSVEEAYEEWIKRIAGSRDISEFIRHFREHAGAHYDRHNREGEASLAVWMIGVLNFARIFEKKFPNITPEDLLFKLCTFHKHHGGVEPPFDVDRFMEEYDGPVKIFQLSRRK